MSAGTAAEAVVWQEVECGGYAADLPLWEELADETEGDVLELGCGCGRVALALARRGHRVVGIDTEAALVDELTRRARSEGLEVSCERADASGFVLDRSFGLVLAPMQMLQLLPGEEGRRGCLESIAAHLRPGGTAAIALVEAVTAGVPPAPPVPDVRELDGWVYSSLPLGVSEGDGELIVERLRQAVSPEGRLDDRRDVVRLAHLDPGQLEREARAAGLSPAGRRVVEPTEAHVGSTVVLLEA
jgi:SAM-dependent methyltransferase